MSQPIVIIGAGGFGREVFSIVQALRRRGGDWDVAGFVDDAPDTRNLALVERLGSTVIGPVAALRSMPGVAAVVAIGSPATRRSIIDGLHGLPLQWPTLIHPDTTIGDDVSLSHGTVVAAGARLSTNIHGGPHVHIDQNAAVGHDVSIGEFSRLNPQACVSGGVTVAADCLIGASATVLAGLSIGLGSTVGAGAVVVRDVMTRTVVKGVPAR